MLPDKADVTEVNPQEVVKTVREMDKQEKATTSESLIGRADKGLFVTTGTFTRDAIKEATRDGATPIDLMDGDQLADKLKELGLGVKTRLVESVDVDESWFQSI